MHSEIKVHVVDYGRSSLYLRYTDPLTGKQIAKSARTSNAKAAQKAAGVWEDELREGRYKPASKITWEEFRDRYESEVLPQKARNTDIKVRGVFNIVEEILSPARLADLTPVRLSYLQTKMREQGRAESTIKGNLAHLRAALSWAKTQRMIHEVPHIVMPTRGTGGNAMRGRPITGEEFDRLAKLENVRKARPNDAADWIRFLNGLWLSGLRISEGLKLRWDGGGFTVDLSGKYPMFRIHADSQKSGRDQILPITPDFGRFLLAIPENERHGRVFKLTVREQRRASRIIAEMGRTAGIITDADRQRYATAHDLRRSFGVRWAKKVMPQRLKELMRHADLSTTMKYYVGSMADEIAAELWQIDEGNTLGNTPPVTPSEPASEESTQAVVDKPR